MAETEKKTDAETASVKESGIKEEKKKSSKAASRLRNENQEIL